MRPTYVVHMLGVPSAPDGLSTCVIYAIGVRDVALKN